MPTVDQALRRIDNLMVWLEVPVRTKHYRWHNQEDALLRRICTRLPRPEVARQVTELLRQLTCDPNAVRSVNACYCRYQQLALTAYNGDPGEMSLARAARESGVPYHVVIQSVEDGELAATRKGKQVYVAKLDYALWFVAYRERRLLQGEILNTLEGESILTKQEAMKLTRLSETHLTRYLQTGVIQAWLLPGIKTGRPGEWLVSKSSAEAYTTARSEGRLQTLLNQYPAYVAHRNQLNRQIRTLRRAGRLNNPDPLERPQSLYHTGCFTVKQVASHARLSVQVVYEAIANGHLKAESYVAGGRPRYAVTQEEAHRFAAEVHRQTTPVRRDTWYLRQITAAGLLTVRDLARRWVVSEAAVLLLAKRVNLPSRKWGRYRVFEPAVIEAYEAQERNNSMIELSTQKQRRPWAAPMLPPVVSPAATEQDNAYQVALALVERIDRDLIYGVRHYRTKDGQLLTTLDEVVRAILSNDLAENNLAIRQVPASSFSRDNASYPLGG